MIAIAVTGRVQEKPNRLVRRLADLYRSALTRSLKVPGLVLGVGAAAFALSGWLLRSRAGYYWQAIRENEDAAQALGINTFHWKILAITISSAMTSRRCSTGGTPALVKAAAPAHRFPVAMTMNACEMPSPGSQDAAAEPQWLSQNRHPR